MNLAARTEAQVQPTGVVITEPATADLQQRLQASEQALAQARAARELAMRSKADFIASISHELRTPLQTIIGFSELGASMAHANQFAANATQGSATTNPWHSEYADMFSDICAGGQRMLNLVNALLDVSSLSSSAGSLTLQRIDMAELIDCVASAAQSQANSPASVSLSSSAPASTLAVSVECATRPLWAQVDAGRMQQVLSNVLANARKFGTSAGVARVEIQCRQTADHQIEMTIRDHGPGIPADELETVFEPFVQSSRTRDGAGGVGLGLTVCRKIMAAHGGSIHASNANGGGTLIQILMQGSSEPADADV